MQHGLVVHDAVAREVEEDRARLDHREALGVQQVARHVQQGDVQRDEVRLLQDLLDAVRAAHPRMQAPRGVDRDLGVEADHLHAELDRGVGDEAADGAEADDAERAMRQLDAGELLLAVLDPRFQIRRSSVEAGDIPQRGADVARRHQQRGEDQFLHRIGVRARCIEHGNTPVRHGGDGDVVGADTRAPDRLHAGRDRHGVHVVRAHEDRIGTLARLADGVAARPESDAARGSRSG